MILHGIALVEAVLNHLGITPRKLRTGSRWVDFPKSVQFWAAHSKDHLEFLGKQGKPKGRTIGETAALLGWVEKDLCEGFDQSEQLVGLCFPLLVGDEQVTFLYAGTPDKYGELPVLRLDVRDQEVDLLAAGFDVWLAQLYDVLPDDDVAPGYKERHKYHVKNILGNKTCLSLMYVPQKVFFNDPQKFKTRKKGRGYLSDELKLMLDKLQKKRKHQLDVAALELVGEYLGKLDDGIVKAVARYMGEDPIVYLCTADAIKAGYITTKKKQRRK